MSEVKLDKRLVEICLKTTGSKNEQGMVNALVAAGLRSFVERFPVTPPSADDCYYISALIGTCIEAEQNA